MKQTPLTRRFARSCPTLLVWAVSLFSSTVRLQADIEGKWIGGWIHFFVMGVPALAGLL